MGGQFRENWKRMANKILPKTVSTAMEDKDLVRVEDIDGLAGLTPSDGVLIIGSGTSWITLPLGPEGYVPKSIGGTVQWQPDASGVAPTDIDLSASGFVVGPGSATNSAVSLFRGNSGKKIKNSAIISDGSGLIIPTYLNASGLTTLTDLIVTNNLSVSGTTTLDSLIVTNNVSISGTTTLNNVTILGDITLGSLNLTGSVGDILYATGIDLFGNLGIGLTGEVLTVLAGAPVWAAASGGSGDTGGPVQVTVESSATVTITDLDYLVAASGATTVNLPPTPADGQRHIIKDSLGTASVTPVTIDGNGHLIDDSATASLVNNYQAQKIIYVGSFGQWQLV